MEITKPLILDQAEPLSKAISEIMDTGTAVIVTKDEKYLGIIDDRNLRYGLTDPKNTKCETCVVRPPTLTSDSSVLDQINAFLLGHFKALPVVDENQMPLGITTRVEVLKEMMDQNLVPKSRVTELMSSPVYMIEETEQIAKAKGLMKEYGARRLIVTRNGAPIGTISTLDLTSYLSKPKERDKRPPVIKEVESVMTRPISEFLRRDITTIDQETTLEQAASKMIERSVSSVVVTSSNKPTGVFSALDLFKKIQQIAKEEISISISGLSDENVWQFPDIKDKIGGVLEKFSKSFNIRNVSVHVKEKKSTYSVFLYFDTDAGHVSLSGERKDLKETVDELAQELNTVLTKKKEKRHEKARKVHSGQEGEVV
jgi:predicted transcriptional regulator